jgi:FlaA1/EpsC-like NDP-sugar epimerase
LTLRNWIPQHPGVRSVVILACDAFFVCVALALSYLLRFEGAVPFEYQRAALAALPVLVIVRVSLNLIAGLHRWSFRMSGLNEATRLVVTTVFGTAVVALVLFALQKPFLPRSVLALEFFLSTALMASFRYSPRLASGWFMAQRLSRQESTQRTIIVGAGNAGDLLLRDLLRSPDHGYQVVGFVDDDPHKRGLSVGGKPVFGTIDQLPDLVRKHAVARILIAIPRLSADRIRTILSLCAALKVSFKIMPASFTYLDERISSVMLNDLSPEDLLPRDQVQFDAEEVERLVGDRRVLVTGGAGSIGSEIARQVAQYGARTLVLVDMNENALYFLGRRLREQHPKLELHTEIADIRDPAKLAALAAMYQPQDVFHAAAHKHVPLMEDAPEEAVKNNVFGTLNVARMAVEHGVERFVFISTDKAVRPSSVMGASKRLAELVVRDVARGAKTKFTTVRFGNVLGSAGSVVPLFKEQIERGGPVTVTHPDCTRYFMTIPEAVGLVLIAGLGHYSELCILDMGHAIRIADLATHMITMSGHVVGVDIPIVFTGLRPGEKIAEEILTEEEEQTSVARNKILAAKSPPPAQDLLQRLERLRVAADQNQRQDIRHMLRELVPSYRPTADAADCEKAKVLPLRRSGSGRMTG